jgi:hypothetical protein
MARFEPERPVLDVPASYSTASSQLRSDCPLTCQRAVMPGFHEKLPAHVRTVASDLVLEGSSWTDEGHLVRQLVDQLGELVQ